MIKRIATLGPIGYLPASGTWASLVTILVIYILQVISISKFVYTSITGPLLLLSMYSIKSSLSFFKHHDPKEIVIDEVLGCWITFLYIPFSWYNVLLGFTLFRFFDITKILGIRWLEHKKGIWGVILDDVAAGVLSNIIMHVFFNYI